MQPLIIYHNPRCSKSRATLALLQERGANHRIVEYLQAPPSEAKLRDLLGKLGISPRELLRRGEKVYAELDLADADDAALISAMHSHPILIERPIVEAGQRAVIGRPPENVLELLD